MNKRIPSAVTKPQIKPLVTEPKTYPKVNSKLFKGAIRTSTMLP